MIPKKIIEKAIEGGWLKGKRPKILEGALRVNQNANLIAIVEKEWEEYITYNVYRIALDPTFWQALGKALGWEKEYMRVNWGQEEVSSVPLWEFYAIKFCGLVLTGGDTEKFWQDLLQDK